MNQETYVALTLGSAIKTGALALKVQSRITARHFSRLPRPKTLRITRTDALHILGVQVPPDVDPVTLVSKDLFQLIGRQRTQILREPGE